MPIILTSGAKVKRNNALTKYNLLTAQKNKIYSEKRGRFLAINLKKVTYKLAFTLAEVLIVLGIIGVVAEMTIPTLKQSIDKQVEVTQLKKFYSVFQDGMKLYMINENCSDMICTNLFNGRTDTDDTWRTNMGTELNKIFKINQDYGYITSSILSSFQTKKLTLAGSQNMFYNLYSFSTVDGYLIGIFDADAGNCSDYSTVAESKKMRNTCASLYVDVNGSKAPNRFGRDVFSFFIGNNGLIFPFGGFDDHEATGTGSYWKIDPTACGTEGSTTIPSDVTGLACAARIMENGWTMDY